MNSYIYTVESESAPVSQLGPTTLWVQQGGSYVTRSEDPWTVKQIETTSIQNSLGSPEVQVRVTFANGESVNASAS